MFINNLPSVISSSNTHTHIYIFADDTKCFKTIKTKSDIQQFQTDLTSLSYWSDNNHLSLTYLNLSSCTFTVNLIQSTLYLGMPLSIPPIVRTLELISLTIYLRLLGGYIIKLLLLKPTNHLACYGVYLRILIALRQEKLYIFQSPDPPYYTVHVCGNPTYCLTLN